MRTHAVHTPLQRAASRRTILIASSGAALVTRAALLARAVLVALAVLCLSPLAAGAATITIDVSGSGDHLTIQDGLTAAAEGDTVLVLTGMYTGAGNRDLDFGTKNLTLISQMGSFWTIIDNQGEPGHRLFDFDGTGQDTTCLVSGFAIRGGRVSSDDGAGVRCVASSPKFAYCRFEDNIATDGNGGAIAAAGGSGVVVRYSTLAENEADRGGALYTSGNSSPVVGTCELKDNVASVEGGALYVASGGGAPRATRCLFRENDSGVNGGAITTSGGSLTATGCTLLRNTAGEGGGALHATEGANSYFTGCTFVGNEAVLRGGCVRVSANTYWCVLTKCIFAFTGPCAQRTIYADGTRSVATLIQCCSHGNAPGDDLPGGSAAYIVDDPLLCDVTADDLTVASNSPCLPGGNGWGQQIGAHGQGCIESTVEERTWGSIKAMYR